jgi:hypothetical protein
MVFEGGEPVGSDGGPYRPPPEDPEAWRDAESRRKGWWGVDLSTTQMLLGLLVLFVVLVGAGRLLNNCGAPAMKAAILSPDNGERLPAGRVIIRARAYDAEIGSRWEVAYTAPGAPYEWQGIGSGSSDLEPGLPGRGLFFLDLTEPGLYRVRVAYHDPTGDRVVWDTVAFTIGD